MVYVDYNLIAARDVQARMRTRTGEMRSWLAELERASKQTLSEWDGEAQAAYYAAKTEWDAGANQAQDIFDRRIATWGLMTDRVEQGDLDGKRALGH